MSCIPGIWCALVGLKCDKGLLRRIKGRKKKKKKKKCGGREVTQEGSENKTQDPYGEMGLIHWPGGAWRTCPFFPCLGVIKAYPTSYLS